ncbi:hypothetical protein [Burkholderia cenocepacia]|uniref:hypothetical protein n=1 Tax=Burkholderia cenocepacia TaxID=95486 RepID=UPI001B99538D|nr:hypothetical protein [Burkholderia cenocepacia]MBR7969105.1 hypothetical protein [Burkholderia cenocepacia]
MKRIFVLAAALLMSCVAAAQTYQVQNLQVNGTATIPGGSIDGTTIGGSVPKAGAFTSVTAPTLSIPTSSGTNPITLTNNNNNQIALPSGSSFQLNGLGSIQFGGNIQGGLLSNDGAPNDIVMNGPSNLPGWDTDFVLYPSPQAGAFLVVNRVGGANQEQFIFGAPYAGTNTNYLFSQVIAGTGQYRPVQFNGGQTDAFTLTTTGNVQFDNHVSANSPALQSGVLSSCGTGGSAAFANDVRGQLQMGTGGVTSCTYTFKQAYASTPTCVLTGLGTGTTVIALAALTTTSFTITSSADISGKFVAFMCMQ